MDKLDNLFIRIINDEQLVSSFDIDPSKYESLEDGKKSLNPQVRAIAEILSQLNKRINEVRADMNLRNKMGPVVLSETDFTPIYKKVVSSFSK